MTNKYYNEWEFKKILKLMETNPVTANLRLETYLKKYNKDYCAHVYYISTLITLGEFKEAEARLKELEYMYINDKDFKNKVDIKNMKKLKTNIISTKIRLLSYHEKYKEIEELYLQHEQELKELDIEIERLIFYCRKKLNQPVSTNPKSYSYIYRQMNRYSEQDFLDHIKKHLPEYNHESSQSIFNSDFPFDKVLVEIKKYIPGEKRLYPYLYADLYIFKYDACGIESNKTVNYFKVVCFHNTSDIITIFPINCSEELPYIDLNYLIKEDIKTKGLSRIDRFNMRLQKKS